MKSLKNLVDDFDENSRRVVKQQMDMQFAAYKEVDWEKILVYKDYEKIVSKMLYKNKVWFFGSAASAVIAAGVKARPIKLAVVELEDKEPLAGKKIGNREMDKMVIIPVTKEEIKEILK